MLAELLHQHQVAIAVEADEIEHGGERRGTLAVDVLHHPPVQLQLAVAELERRIDVDAHAADETRLHAAADVVRRQMATVRRLPRGQP